MFARNRAEGAHVWISHIVADCQRRRGCICFFNIRKVAIDRWRSPIWIGVNLGAVKLGYSGVQDSVFLIHVLVKRGADNPRLLQCGAAFSVAKRRVVLQVRNEWRNVSASGVNVNWQLKVLRKRKVRGCCHVPLGRNAISSVAQIPPLRWRGVRRKRVSTDERDSRVGVDASVLVGHSRC